jgi:hypothetical protein
MTDDKRRGASEAKGRGGETEVTPHKDMQHERDTHAPEKSKKQLDRELDEALMESFPGSDPISPSQPTGTEPAGDPKVKP